MEADIPSGETKREQETDGNVVTKAEDVEAATFPIVEANKESGIDGECALRSEVDEAANRVMETGGEQATVAKEDEHDSIPTAESNREMGTIEEATDRESAIKDVFDEAAHREMEKDAEEVTVAKENEPDLIPTAEANRDIKTVDVARVDEDKDDALISITEASREMETDEVEATKVEEESASIPMVDVRRQLEMDRKHTMEAEDGENASVPTWEADIELETDGDDGVCAEDRETAKYIPKAEDGEGSSVPTEEGNRELETDGEVMEVKDSETATYITKSEHSDDVSVPTEEANRELETDRDDVMEVEDRETASFQTVEGNREFIEDVEDIMRSEDAEDNMRSEDGEAASMLEDSQEDPQYGENEASTAEETATEIETETDVVDSAKGFSKKHKKRKNSNSPSTPKATTRAPRRKVTGEDVCFICFDGGDLVLCDRRGCPKAYHPSCVNRDEAFFRAKGRWNCGWHQCSICEKNPHYMCYTCPYSLCKGCVKGAVFLCIRRNKGFCETCIRVVRLIESNQQGGEDIHVDFDDKSSWEFLFKDYYMDLKEKLSLSSEEIANAKSAWKGSDVSGNRHEQSAPHFDSNEDGGSGSDNSGEKVEVNSLKRRKITKRSKSISKEAAMSNMPVIAGNEGTSTPGSTTWASKELIEFVKHMRNGDTSVVPQFEVQTLLLEYIQRNKLRTPNKKSQITCDSRLQSLFGKPRVMHFEMLKLLESHFHIKEDSHTDDAHGTVVDTEIEADENQDTPVREVKDRKHKRKKGNIRGPQYNLDDYAAIDMHNIGLIYGRRKLMEDLLEDVENFQDKIVGTFVRIRISGNNQKQDMYRLVQVIGLSKTSDPYKVGKRTTDILLEILNLNKTEVISIDTISNQDFTEDECKRLRQSMKCGLINRPKVGVILDKALELHEARVNDWLESEILRITNLRDRASEKGRRKELRECVEKLALLKTPEERQRRLEEIPEIHDDPKMDPSYESEDDDIVTDENRRDSYIRSRDSSFSRRGRDPISPRSNYSPKNPYPRSNSSPKDPYGGGANQMQAKNWEPDRNLSRSVMVADNTHKNETFDENPRGLGRGDRDLEYRSMDKVNLTTTISRHEMASGVVPVTSPVTPTPKVADNGGGPKINETEKVWHYQDPSGKNQGPFSMVQLRKWNNTGYFPANLRIWRSTETQDDSVLLTDALSGRLQKEIENRILASNVLQKQEGDRLSLDQNHVSPNAPTGSVLPAASNEKWGGNDSLNLPSPTPTQVNAAPAPTPFAGDTGIVSEPSRLVLPAGISSLLSSSSVSSGGQPLMNSENVSANSSTVFSPMMNTNAVSEPQPTMMVHNQHATQDPNVHPIQNPNMDANVLGSVPTAPGQPQMGYGNWGGSITSAVQNLAASFSNTGGGLAVPQPDYWMGQTQGNQPQTMQPQTMQPQTMPTFQQWMPQNGPAPVWGPVQANPNMGWVGPTPPMNMNWVAPVPTMAPPPNMGWVMPPTGPMPGNMNPGWIPPPPPPQQQPQPGNPGVQTMAPPNANPGWSGPSAPRPRSGGPNRQPPSGGGGPRGSSYKRQMPCPYNTGGRCRKGARCDYLHV